MKILEKHENHKLLEKETYAVKTCSNCGSVLEILRKECDLERRPFGDAYCKCPVCNNNLVIHYNDWEYRESEEEK